jgi:hypothetical protein
LPGSRIPIRDGVIYLSGITIGEPAVIDGEISECHDGRCDQQSLEGPS